MKVENQLTETIEGITWSILRLALPGQVESGDRYYVKAFRDRLLLAAIDGLGHGHEAALAGKKAIQVLDEHAKQTDSLMDLVKRCHEDLKNTRGVVMNIASFNWQKKTMSWIGIGNVNGFYFHREKGEIQPSQMTIMQRSGIVGFKLPVLQVTMLPLQFGDTLIFTTDGIQNDYVDELYLQGSTEQIAEYISKGYSKKNDDALILVARYLRE